MREHAVTVWEGKVSPLVGRTRLDAGTCRRREIVGFPEALQGAFVSGVAECDEEQNT